MMQIEQPEVILLDLMMPEMDGFEFISSAASSMAITACDCTHCQRLDLEERQWLGNRRNGFG